VESQPRVAARVFFNGELFTRRKRIIHFRARTRFPLIVVEKRRPAAPSYFPVEFSVVREEREQQRLCDIYTARKRMLKDISRECPASGSVGPVKFHGPSFYAHALIFHTACQSARGHGERKFRAASRNRDIANQHDIRAASRSRRSRISEPLSCRTLSLSLSLSLSLLVRGGTTRSLGSLYDRRAEKSNRRSALPPFLSRCRPRLDPSAAPTTHEFAIPLASGSGTVETRPARGNSFSSYRGLVSSRGSLPSRRQLTSSSGKLSRISRCVTRYSH